MGFNNEYPLPPAMKLVFEDHFDGRDINTSVWNVQHYWRRNKNWWNHDDAYVQSSNLVLRVRKDSQGYQSGAIETRDKFSTTYGYFECRMKPGIHGGHWGAFWLMPYVNQVGNEGNEGTEIDVAETVWRRTINQALHWDQYGAGHKWANHQVDIAGLRDAYHAFGMWWKPDEYVFYVDGVETWRTNAGGVSDGLSYLFLSEEVDDWGGTADCDVDYTLVDYVRVYQLKEGEK